MNIIQDDNYKLVTKLKTTTSDIRGRVFVLNLDLLLEQFGDKRHTKLNFVFEHLSDSFSQKFKAPNWGERLNDHLWLVTGIDFIPRSGALLCAEIWYELCTFFLGRADALALQLFEVFVLDDDLLKFKPINLDSYYNKGINSANKSAPIRDVPKPKYSPSHELRAAISAIPTVSPPNLSLVFSDYEVSEPSKLQIGGQEVKVASALEPVFALKSLSLIGYRFEPKITEINGDLQIEQQAIKSLTPKQREYFDLANMEQGLELLRAKPREQRKILVVVPVAFSTMSQDMGRAKALLEVSRASSELGLKVLFELKDIQTVPHNELCGIVAIIKPHCMAVIGHVDNRKNAATSLNHSGLSGVCVEYDGRQRDEVSLQTYLSELSVASKAISSACMIHGLDNLRQVAVARLAGLSHASVRSSAIISMNKQTA